MPRTRSLAWAELKIGITAVVAIFLAGFLIFLLGGQGGYFWQQYHLKTRFPNVLGLKEGALVRVAGVEVGKVSSMQFSGADVEVGLELHKDMQDKVTTESRAMLGSLSLLGEAVVDITAARTGTPLKDWDYIPSVKTPGQIAEVAEGASKGIEEITKLLQDIRGGKGTLGKLVTDEQLYKELNQFLASAQGVVDGVNKGKGTLGRLTNDPRAYNALQASLENLQEVTRRINAGEGSLGKLLKDDAFAKSLSATTTNFETLSGNINKGQGTIGKLATDAALYNRLNAVTERLDTLTTRLNAGEGTAGQLLHDKQLYENMNGAVSEIRGLVEAIKKDPKKYLNIKVSIF